MFFHFFDVLENKTKINKNSLILNSHKYLKNKSIFDIKLAQKRSNKNSF